ncbi:D-alanyl-D-alanine carboxypeptidase [Streptomyces sp. NPDC093252]|uniref:D-alanyl-D-alanine carboxypeptidase n=1 Tax=Streptomyces sp. NPDC093252 TaxID=3154980 RepID=UPI00341CD4F4
MAGESPDRSKQRESSAEPTSGSGAPVPDPRVAVPRDRPHPEEATTDSTTRVLTVPPRTTPEAPEATPAPAPAPSDTTRMREAVAAWVTPGSAESSGGAGSAESGGDAGGARDAGGAGDPGERVDAADGAGAPGEPRGTREHGEPGDGADGAKDAGGPREATGSAGGAAGETVDATRDAGEPEDATHGATYAADGTADATGEAGEPEGRAGDAGEPQDAAPDAGEPEDAAHSAAAGTDRTADAIGDTEGRPEGVAGDAGEPRDAARDAEEPEDAVGGARAAGEPQDAATDAEEPRDAGKAPEDAQDAPGGAQEAPEDAVPGAPEDADAAAEGAEDRVEDGKDEGGEGGDRSRPAPEPTPAGATLTLTAAARSGAAAPEDADQDEDAAAPAPVAARAAAPAAADGDSAPQRPPAPGDETRTGGAGGKHLPAEGEAEAAPEPPEPLDHPTAMLKLPPTPEAERTSKFVALKPLEAPAERPATRPAARPAEPPAGPPQVGPEFTTQQPLPPKPPLDLLAELTNTPPPPATPLRTVVRRVKIWTPLVLLLLVVFAVVQTVRPVPPPSLALTAQESHTFEGGEVSIPWPEDGQAALDVQGIGSFGSSGEQKPVPIASVAKVMTAYIILRDHPLKSGEEGKMLDIDQRAEEESDAGQESTVDVTAGDRISQREALESILIASANNVARLLARWDAGSDEAFVDKMNATAEDLGMTNTTYTDPSGLNDSTVSTAVDQVKLGKAAMEMPVFREVAAMMSYDDYQGVNHSNWNQIVGSNGVVGIKTGTTTSALGNLLFAATKEVGGETRTVVGAVVRQPAGGSDNTILQGALSAGDRLIRAAQEALTAQTLLKKGDVVGYVDDGLGGRTPVVATREVNAAGWSGLEVELSFTEDELPRTAKAGTKVGSLTVGDGSGGAVSVPVALQQDLVEPAWTDKLTRIG